MGPRSYLRKRLRQRASGMKKISYHCCVLLIAALACAGLSGCETSSTAAPGATASVTGPATQGGAQLVIRRAPNMGTGLFLDIKIDGVSVGSIGVGETYRGPLSPGQHTVSVLLRPNQLSLSPTRKSFTVAKGQTYTLTAAWQGSTVVFL
jgi:hypothetical protein